MAFRDYPLYDTAPFGTSAGVQHVLFQTGEGADTTHTTDFTNMRGSGSLPQSEKFEFDRVLVIPDYNTVLDDIPKICAGSWLSFERQQKRLFIAPLWMFISHAAYGGHYSQTTAADEAVIGLLGNGLKLREKIMLADGKPFRVVVYQALALAGANSNMKVVLDGMLDDGS